jgi:hypothetical protein
MNPLMKKAAGRFGLSAEGWNRGLGDGLLVVAVIVLVTALIGVALSIMGAAVALATTFATGDVIGHPLTHAAWNPVGSLLLAIAALAIIAGGIADVLQIIVTVAERKAFDPANARRITRLAWRLIELALLGWIAGWLGLPIGGSANGFHIAVDMGGNNIAFALVLFVLARVFRHGNRLQDEVEGTV